MEITVIKKPKKIKLNPAANKYTRGVVAIKAGAKGFAGAAYFCGKAAMLTGAGLVKYKQNDDILPALSVLIPEAVHIKGDGYLSKATAHLVGPGLVGEKDILKDIPYNLPTVIDAEGINALKENINILEHFNAGAVITPHIGEFSRLISEQSEKVAESPITYAQNFSKTHKGVLVLKGEHTVVAENGKVFVNNCKSPVLATAGSGDILAGMIAAFLSMGLSPVDASKNAVYLHGKCGRLAEKRCGTAVTATTLLSLLPEILK